ncbi:response regulator transcription factor [Bacillus sp. RG28]|uniref:Response regulator transcription factor n=1 Tax=Gottfriedia endophytica TaxID=2820819 RepID=A0A940NWV1_9BACI|nr:response regulator transcription factor [Gottfriedia endophytica]MBP0726433.1 response regulator transcription factor [Gottfriedia endophytica]
MKIIIAEDQGMLRGAMATLLDMEDDIEVVALAENGEEALKLIDQHKPDICVTDIEMPVLTGLDLAEKLKSEKNPCKVVIVTTFERSGYFKRAMKAGVQGYFLKETPVSELANYLRKVNKGNRVISPELTYFAWEEENPLTEREKDVLKQLSDGLTVKDISTTLFLSQGTIRNYISEIMQKLEAKNRIDAVSIAKENGWI